jgi:hypothetical protein
VRGSSGRCVNGSCAGVMAKHGSQLPRTRTMIRCVGGAVQTRALIRPSQALETMRTWEGRSTRAGAQFPIDWNETVGTWSDFAESIVSGTVPVLPSVGQFLVSEMRYITASLSFRWWDGMGPLPPVRTEQGGQQHEDVMVCTMVPMASSNLTSPSLDSR